jgi:hypothetical protein
MQTVQDGRGRERVGEEGRAGSGRRAIWFPALLLLDAFLLGGITALVLVEQLLTDTMTRMNQSIPGDAFGVIPHVQDKLLLYWLGYIGLAVLLGLATMGAYLWMKLRSGQRA